MYLFVVQIDMVFKLFAILQKYDFSSKSQLSFTFLLVTACCLRYCKSTIFQANHNALEIGVNLLFVVCDTAKVRFFKQITTMRKAGQPTRALFAILQKYDFSSKSQRRPLYHRVCSGCLRYCKSTIFQANHNPKCGDKRIAGLFAILQKYDFSSKSQHLLMLHHGRQRCLRYCKSTIFQANHNHRQTCVPLPVVVCDTAKVRFFKQITTNVECLAIAIRLFAILQKYDFSSKSQPSAILSSNLNVVCDTAKVRFFKQITTVSCSVFLSPMLFAILQKYDFSSKSQPHNALNGRWCVVCDTAKVRFFKQITTYIEHLAVTIRLFAILQKYDFSSKSQHEYDVYPSDECCLRYCKSTIFQANHNKTR